MRMRMVQLGDVLHEVDARAGTTGAHLPVLSLTKGRGLILQTERFRHRIATDDVSAYKIVRRGQIVYNPYVLWEGAIHALRHPDAGLVSPVYPVWEVGEDLDGEYIDHVLRSPRLLATYERLCSGTVKRRRSVNRTTFRSIAIPLPTLDEQKRIARVLTRAAASYHASLREYQAHERLTQILRGHVFNGLTASAVPLSDLILSIQNGLYKPGSSYSAVGVPIVRINDYPNDGGVLSTAPLRVQLDQVEIMRWALADGDLLVNRVNSLSHLGKVALVRHPDKGLVYESNMMRLRLDGGRIDPEYAFHFMRSAISRRHFVTGAKRAVAQSSINQGDVASLRVPLPTIEAQELVVRILGVADEAQVAAESAVKIRDVVLGSLSEHMLRAVA